ncbi:hypothetical protein QAD02_009804 [Eretmocerus hayati]|uniref:Uncharacterized protein n=1 Tax=Eretmocerus hayati TaxID=131215 RepID=A0ACC2NBT1_9HYME|nr:hypothetical protein QAD02_009804 [Eretmocerus hayati]
MQRKSHKSAEEASSPLSARSTSFQGDFRPVNDESCSLDHRNIAKKLGISITTVQNHYLTLAKTPQIHLIDIKNTKDEIEYSSQPRSRSASPVLGLFRKRVKSKAKQSSTARNDSTVDENAHENVRNYLSSMSSLKQESPSVVGDEEPLSQQKCFQAPLKSWASWPSNYSSGDEFELSKYSVSSRSQKSQEMDRNNLVMNHFHQSTKTPKNSPKSTPKCSNNTPQSSPVFDSRRRSKTPKKSPMLNFCNQNKTPKNSPVLGLSKSRTPKSSPVFRSRSKSKTPRKNKLYDKGEKVTLARTQSSIDVDDGTIVENGLNGIERGTYKVLKSSNCAIEFDNSPKSLANSLRLGTTTLNGDSFWGALGADPALKKQKFIETFKIEKEQDSEESEEEYKILHVPNPVSSAAVTNNADPANIECSKKTCCKVTNSESNNTSDDLNNAGSLIDSMLVHGPTVFHPREKNDIAPVVNGEDSHIPILSFGDDLFQSCSKYATEDDLMNLLIPFNCNQLANDNVQKNMMKDDDVIMSEEKTLYDGHENLMDHCETSTRLQTNEEIKNLDLQAPCNEGPCQISLKEVTSHSADISSVNLESPETFLEPNNTERVTANNKVAEELVANCKTASELVDDTEETFESLCKDVCELTNISNVTLYKGDETESTQTPSEKIVLRVSGDQFDTLGIKKLDALMNGDRDSSHDDSGNRSPVLCRPKPLRLKKKLTPNPKLALNNLQDTDQQIESFEKQKSVPSDASPEHSTVTSSQPISRDPRLNKSLSPSKQVSTSTRDPRLNRSMSSLKAPVVREDSNLMTRNSASFSGDNPSIEVAGNGNGKVLEKIVDPRLRKRKEREEAEKKAKLNASNVEINGNDLNASKLSPNSHEGTIKRSSVFDRLGPGLGAKKVKLTPSPEHLLDFAHNEFLDIIKTGRRSPSECGTRESGDEHRQDLDDVFSSGEEEPTASPPHRKFTSERVDYVEPEPVFKSDMPGGYRKNNRRNELSRGHMDRGLIGRDRFSPNQNFANQNRFHHGQGLLPIPPFMQQHPILTPVQPQSSNIQPNPGQKIPLLPQPPPVFNQQILTAPILPAPPPNIHQRVSIPNQTTSVKPISVHQRLTLPGQSVPKQTSNVHQRLSLPAHKLPAQPPQVQKVTEPEPTVTSTRTARNFNPHAAPPKSGNDLSYDFYEMNNEQLRKDLENFETQSNECTDKYVTFDGDPEAPNKFDDSSILGDSVQPPKLGMTDGKKTNFFKRACYKFLKTGKCNSGSSCAFSHEVGFLHKLLKQTRPQLLYPILDFAISYRFEHFFMVTWATILESLQEDSFSIFEKLYEINVRGDQLIREFLNFCIATKLHTPESFIKKISPIISVDDRSTVRSIWVAIKDKLRDGFCWESVKDLCQKAVPPLDMIEITVLQCLHRKKNPTHIKEVYDFVENRLTPEEKRKMSPDMLKKFIDLVKEKGIPVTKENPVVNAPVKCLTSTKSPLTTQKKSTDIAQQRKTLNAISTRPPSPVITRRRILSPIRPPQPATKLPQASLEISRKSQSQVEDQTPPTKRLIQPLNTPLQTNTIQQQRRADLAKQLQFPTSSSEKPANVKPLEASSSIPCREESQATQYNPEPIDALERPSAGQLCQKRFYKLYAAVDTIKRGLENEDYDYVWKTMNEFSDEGIEMEFKRRAYYQILCRDVKNSQRHVTEIIQRAVRCDSSQESKKVLFEVGVCALIDLANANLWVMALQLLNKVKILEPAEPDCTFVLISTEILLSNNDPLEALDLLKSTKLLRTNRDEWRIKESNVFDEKHRNKLVLILMKALSYVDQEKALWLFKELLKDQYICYFPIDLPLYMDELALLFLIFGKDDLAADLSRIAMANDLTFNKSTYQELISRMLPYDEILANQLLDYAIHLGYYNDIQIKNGHTYVIIDINYLEEEMFMILKRLIRKLTMSVGPGVDHLKPSSLKVILILEDIPDEKRLYRNDMAVLTQHKYKNVRNAIGTILSTRFSPPIRISSGKASKYCKLVSRTVVDYLKHWR